MKIYISIPISGRPPEVAKAQAERLKRFIESKGHKAITPFEVCPEPDMPYSFYMGRDIEALLDCDAICHCMNYRHSLGCQLEKEAARIYKKRIIYEYDMDELEPIN